jgi:SH3-like domain-containing protein
MAKQRQGPAQLVPACQKRVFKSRAMLDFLISRVVLSVLIAAGLSAVGPEAAAADQTGSATGRPVPRFVSLKTDRVNLREGPSKDHPTKWVFERAGLPVEITAEFETWRKVRDSEGAEGWVLHSLLSGRRTVLVAPWKHEENFKLFIRPSDSSDVVATLQSGVLGDVRGCDGRWCRISGEGFDGYIQQTDLWGVYPNEQVE